MIRQNSIRSLALTTTLLVLALLMIACGSAPATPPAVDGPLIELREDQFHPGTLEVPAGTTVTWWWNDSDIFGFAKHNVISATFQSPEQNTGTFEHRFVEPGTYTYVCTLHEKMQGTITVVEATDTSTTP